MCPCSGMAKRFEDLTVWQLADRLRRDVHALSARPQVRRDVRFCDQLRDSASGIPRNIAEGFGHYRHGEFARYLFIARGSLMELRDHLRDGASRGHWTEADVQELAMLCNRTSAALSGLIRYLKGTR
jgi:four helix bundle protein